MSLPIAILRAKRTAAPKVQAAIIRATIVIFYLIACSARQNYALSAPTSLSQLCSRLFADFPKRQRHTALVTLVATENSVLLPVRGATRGKQMKTIAIIFQSTLPLRGATSMKFPVILNPSFQSTLPVQGATVSIRVKPSQLPFQSTLPVRGATANCNKNSLQL